MGFFSKFFNKSKSDNKPAEAYKLDNPIIYKEKSDYNQLKKLENMLNQKEYSDYKNQIEDDIIKIKSGDYGENQVKYYLMHSYIPMYILHDVYLEYDVNNKAQIDFLVITRKMIFVIECKNFSFSSSVHIGKDRQFIVTMKDNAKQSIKNPIEQNRIHIEVINKFSPEIRKICFPLVVFTNENSILDYNQAPDDIKNHVVRADNLVSHIKTLIKNSRLSEISDSDMQEYADFFLEKNTKNSADYTEKYKKRISEKSADKNKKTVVNIPKQKSRFIICPNCSKTITKKSYYSCECGMNFTIYGERLSDEQIDKLLNKKCIDYKSEKYGLLKVYPEIVPYKDSFQWKRISAANRKK